MFEVGQYIVCNGDGHYALTNESSLCVVTYVYEGRRGNSVREYDIRAQVIATTDVDVLKVVNDNQTRETDFPVDSRYFTLVDDPVKWVTDNGGIVTRFWNIDDGNEFKEKKEVVEVSPEPVAVDYERDDLIKETRTLLEDGFNGEDFGYETTDYGVGVMLDTWRKNKSNPDDTKRNLDGILANHPNYIKGKHYIAIPKSEFHRNIDRAKVRDFCNWAVQNIPQPKQKRNSAWTYSEVELYVSHYKDIIREMDELRNDVVRRNGFPNYVTFNGMTREGVVEEYERFKALYDNYKIMYRIKCGRAFDIDEYQLYENRSAFFCAVNDIVKEMKNGILNEENANILNDYANKSGIDLGAVSGQKLSRVVGKYSKAIGLDKVKDVRPNYRGEQKDYGYNYQYALFSDAINTLVFDQTLVISVNPIDYLTMSFGNSWQSCHTIDKWGKRRASHDDDQHNYSGCYSSGTESYMLDSVSMIVYTVDPKYDGGSLQNLEKANKMKRCVFCYGKNKLLQSRLYPDGRNNAEHGIDDLSTAGEFRNMVQKVITDCLGIPNMWILRKGTRACDAVTISEGTHYRDYTHYEDCNVSFYNDGSGNLNMEYITIGHDPICPNCGEEHSSEDWITCEDCRHGNDVRCARCGDWVDRDDAIYCEDNGNYYCDDDCAEEDGVHYCDDDEEYHDSDNYFYDDEDGNYYHDDSEMVTTSDGNHYRTAEVAMDEGYVYVDGDDEWYPEDEVHYCEHCDRYVHENNWNDDLECCEDCEDEVRAEREEREDERIA